VLTLNQTSFYVPTLGNSEFDGGDELLNAFVSLG
jgi:2',3'-cyclic-nucleotide 2'-phosphodiesterase (5'-nucleotidase family)